MLSLSIVKNIYRQIKNKTKKFFGTIFIFKLKKERKKHKPRRIYRIFLQTIDHQEINEKI